MWIYHHAKRNETVRVGQTFPLIQHIYYQSLLFFSFLLMFYFHFMYFDHSDIEYQGILQIWQIGILHQTTSPMYFNPLQGDVECRRQTNIFLLFQKLSKIKFSLPYWIQHEKCIQMSTNKPSIGVVVLEIAIQILTFSNTNL